MDLYDENQAVSHINEALKVAGRNPYDEDELLNVIDMIWDYYEENGLLDPDFDEEDPEDDNIAAELVDYVQRMLKKDKHNAIDPADVLLIVEAELDYEDSILE